MESSALAILHLSSARTWRGGEQQIAYLVETLHQQQIQQYIFCVEDSPLAHWCKAQHFPSRFYKKRSAFDLKVAKQIRVICKEKSITHVHAHDSHAHTFAWLAAECFGNLAAIIVSRRVDFPVSSGNLLTRRKYNHPRIKTIICISHQIKRVLSPAIRDATKLVVVHSGIDLSKFSNASNLLRVNYGIANHTFVVGNVAALAGHKDYFTFVNTAKVLIEQHFPIHFFIIGADGGEQSAIEEHIQMLDLQSYITLTGYRNDIPELLPALDVLLFTSKEEGLGTTILDAFASHVAVVATRAGGIPEMVEHGITGMLAEIGDSVALANHVKTILLDTHLKSRIQQNAWRKVQEFSKENMAQGVLRVYNS